MLMAELPNLAANDLATVRVEAGVEIYTRSDAPAMLILAQGRLPEHVGCASRELSLLFADGRYGPTGGAHLFHVALWVPFDFRAEFLAWYQTEHLPILLECSAWQGCRFAEEKVTSGHQFHALHQLACPDALNSEERRLSRQTPWFKRLAVNEWFDRAFRRSLYRRLDA